MKMLVVGIQKVDFIPKDSDTPVKGVKLHVVKECTENQSKFIRGRVVDTVFIGSSSSLSKFDFKLDTVYDFVYEFDGRRGYLTDIKPTA